MMERNATKERIVVLILFLIILNSEIVQAKATVNHA